jgi:hypothetical protein
MMVNNKYTTAWTYYDGTKSMNVNLGFSAVTKNYSTLMHAKFMHELCRLLMHIPTY